LCQAQGRLGHHLKYTHREDNADNLGRMCIKSNLIEWPH